MRESVADISSLNWKTKTVEQVFDFYPTASYPRDKQCDSSTENEVIKYIHYGDIHTKFNIILDISKSQVPIISKDLQNGFELLKDGDLIIADTSEDYDGVGKCVEVINANDSPTISGLHTLMLRPKEDDFVDGFKGYYFSSEYIRNKLLRIVTGIKVYSINKTSLAKVKLYIPPKAEQTAIANILSKVNETIAAVQTSIDAAERLKKSLMQNLLTGKMKPDGTFRTPEEFYTDPKFGKVPLGWEVKKVKECFKFKNGKGNATKNLKVIPDDEYGIPVYGGNGITGYYNQALLTEPTIIVGRVGEYCGNVFQTPSKAWVTDNAMLVSEVLIDEYDIDFFTLKLNSLCFKRFSDNTGQPKITQGSIGGVYYAYPSKVKEQNEIISLINQVQREIQKKNERIVVLENLKKSLMQNLLTGKVRIS